MKCPVCGEEITHLVNYTNELVVYYVGLDKNGELGFKKEDSIPSDSALDEYECPVCSIVLFDNPDDAVKFIKGECDD